MNETPSIDRRSLLKGVSLSLGSYGFGIQAASAEGSDPPAPDNANTVRFKDLTDEGKEMFTSGIRGGNYTRRNGFPTKLRENRYVVYDGHTYLLNKSFRYERRNAIRPESVSADTVPDEAGLLKYDGLTEQGRKWFDKAKRNGKHEVDAHNGWAFNFSDTFLLREGAYYQLNFSHSDIPQYTIRPIVYRR